MSRRYPKVCSDCGWPESRKVVVEACPTCYRNVCRVCRETFHVEADIRFDCPNCGEGVPTDEDGWCVVCSETCDVTHIPWSEQAEVKQEPEQERRAS